MDLSTMSLHDATLLGLHFEWASGTCRIDLHGAPSHSEPFSITIAGVTRLEIPAEFPWGPSVSVNEFRALKGGGVEIEMQSGDTIRVVAPNNSSKPTPLRGAA